MVCPHDGTEIVSAANDPLIGQRVGAYEVLRRLGIGGMGAVYEGRDTVIDKRVALKIVHLYWLGNAQLPSLVNEAKAVNAIGDDGIVNIFAFLTLPDGRPALVMEMLDGEPLDVRIAREGPMKLSDVLAWGAAVLHALEAAHQAGFIHRDVKAGNIFLAKKRDGSIQPKVLDFGIALRASATEGQALGTVDYAAPEQVEGKKLGPAADLYAFGCLLFELCTGHVPFRAKESFQVLELHRSGPRPSAKAERSELPDKLDALIRKLMSPAPEGRPASAAKAREVLLEIARDLAPAPAVPKRRTGLIVGVMVALAALAAAVALRPREPVLDPHVEAVKRIRAELQAGHLLAKGTTAGALTLLQAARAAEPGHADWVSLDAEVKAAVTTQFNAALERDDEPTAQTLLVAAGDVVKAERADLEKTLERRQLARRTNMVRVGAGFIDAYEYPNRAGVAPATNIDWQDAVSLCERAGKHLCSEAEWEAACRGKAKRAFAYGSEFEKGRCIGQGSEHAAPAGAFGRCVTEEGVFDLAGNVAEWTSSAVSNDKPQRITRGGSFAQSDAKQACEARDYFLPGLGGSPSLGFRCCL